MFTFRACVFLSGMALVSCTHVPPPLPPIHPAAPDIAALRFVVINASDYEARTAGETTVTGYTLEMRAAVQRSLTRAGFTVVVTAHAPADLWAKIDVESPSLSKPGLASMTLANADGVVIEQVSGIIVLDENVDIDERGPIAIVEKMAQSPRIIEFARGHRRGECEKIDMPKKNVLEVPANQID